MNRGGLNDPEASQNPRTCLAKRKRDPPPTHTHHEEPFRQRPAVAGLVSSHSKCLKDQLAVPPGSAAWLPCSAIPWCQASATCSLLKCVDRPGAPDSTRNAAASSFFPIVTVAQEQVGGQGEGRRQSWPLPMPTCHKYSQENSGEAVRAPRELFWGICLMPRPASDLGGTDDITNLSSLNQVPNKCLA